VGDFGQANLNLLYGKQRELLWILFLLEILWKFHYENGLKSFSFSYRNEPTLEWFFLEI